MCGKVICFAGTLTLVVLMGTPPAMAARCSGIVDPVLCDDFDSWCLNPPAWPDVCPAGSSTDTTSFRAYWQELDGNCGPLEGTYSVRDNHPWSVPFNIIIPQNQDTVKLARHANVMTDEILAHPENINQDNGVNGAGEILMYNDPSYVDPSTIPEVLKGQFFLWLGNVGLGAYPYMTYYTELYVDDPVAGGRAPINYRVTDCYPEAQGPYPVVQYSDGAQHPSFAFGMLSYLDQAPCTANGNDRRPQLYRAVVYDGQSWIQLKGYLNANADFRLDNSWNRFYYYIGASHIEVRLYNTRATTEAPEGYFVARIPRQYTGGFNAVGLGASKGLDTGPGECKGPAGSEICYGGMNDGQSCSTAADCPPYPGTCDVDTCVGGTNHGNACTTDDDCPDAPSTEECLPSPPISNNAFMDDLVLWDGVFVGFEPTGACCEQVTWSTGTCTATVEEDCTGPNQTWLGLGTTCGDCDYCPNPYPDTDRDGDVDQKDFALFQDCITGLGGAVSPECACFDRDGQAGVGEDDFALFVSCASGPAIPADPACDGAP